MLFSQAISPIVGAIAFSVIWAFRKEDNSGKLVRTKARVMTCLALITGIGVTGFIGPWVVKVIAWAGHFNATVTLWWGIAIGSSAVYCFVVFLIHVIWRGNRGPIEDKTLWSAGISPLAASLIPGVAGKFAVGLVSAFAASIGSTVAGWFS